MEEIGWFTIIGRTAAVFWPVWVGMALIFALSISFKRRLGLYGKLFDSTIGMIGFALVLFWVLVAIFAPMIVTFDPLAQMSGMKNAVPGTATGQEGGYPFYLLGGDSLARDVFSRMVMGARDVLKIAPAAALIAYAVGICLGLPAGYIGGWWDDVLSFLANLVLAFPVILLFFLLVTPEIRATGIPNVMAAVLFAIPLVLIGLLIQSRFVTQPGKKWLWLAVLGVIGLWAYAGLAFNADPLGVWRMPPMFDPASERRPPISEETLTASGSAGAPTQTIDPPTSRRPR